MKDLLLIQSELSTPWASWWASWEGLSLLLILVHLCAWVTNWHDSQSLRILGSSSPILLTRRAKPAFHLCSTQGPVQLLLRKPMIEAHFLYSLQHRNKAMPRPVRSFTWLLTLDTSLVLAPELARHRQAIKLIRVSGEVLFNWVCFPIWIILNHINVHVTTEEAVPGKSGL